MSEFYWPTGEKDRPVNVCRPDICDDAPAGAVGYLSGSNPKGQGFTIWLFDERVYCLLQELLGGELLDGDEVG